MIASTVTIHTGSVLSNGGRKKMNFGYVFSIPSKRSWQLPDVCWRRVET